MLIDHLRQLVNMGYLTLILLVLTQPGPVAVISQFRLRAITNYYFLQLSIFA